jgi:hypothetical protein
MLAIIRSWRHFVPVIFWTAVYAAILAVDKIFRSEVVDEVDRCIRSKRRRKAVRDRLRNLVDIHILTEAELDPGWEIRRATRREVRAFLQDNGGNPEDFPHIMAREYPKAIIAYWATQGLPLHHMVGIGYLPKKGEWPESQDFILGNNEEWTGRKFRRSLLMTSGEVTITWKDVGKEIRILHHVIQVLQAMGLAKDKKTGWEKSGGFDRIAGKIANTPSNLHPLGRARKSDDPGVDHAEDRPDRKDDLLEQRIALLSKGHNLPRCGRIEMWKWDMFPLDPISMEVQADKAVDLQKKWGFTHGSYVDPFPGRKFWQEDPSLGFVRLWKPYVLSPTDLMREVYGQLFHIQETGVLDDGWSLPPQGMYRNVKFLSQPYEFQLDGMKEWDGESYLDEGIVSKGTNLRRPIYHGRLVIRLFTYNVDKPYYQLFWVLPVETLKSFLPNPPEKNGMVAKYVAFQVFGGLYDEVLRGFLHRKGLVKPVMVKDENCPQAIRVDWLPTKASIVPEDAKIHLVRMGEVVEEQQKLLDMLNMME